MANNEQTYNAVVDEHSPKQHALSLFQETGIIPKASSSNTISFYDLMPKFIRSRTVPSIVYSDKESRAIYDFIFDGRNYISVVTAARIDTQEGIEYHFPTSSEELVEDVLRHLLTANPNRSFFEENVGVKFSLYAISNELKKYNKTRSITQIRHSLKILRLSTLEVYRADKYNNGQGEPIFSGNFFSDATVIDTRDWFDRVHAKEEIKGLVKFHNMVSMGIAEKNFKLLRYDICMRYKSELARWLHKRISHRHNHRDQNIPYKIKLSTIFNDANFLWNRRLDKNLTKLQTAIENMCCPGRDSTGAPLPSMLREEKPFSLQEIKRNDVLEDYHVNLYLSDAFLSHLTIAQQIHEKWSVEQESYDSDYEQLPEECQPSYKILLRKMLHKTVAKNLALAYTYPEVEKAIAWVEAYLARVSKTRKDETEQVNEAGFIYKTLTQGWYLQNDATKDESAQLIEAQRAIEHSVDLTQLLPAEKLFFESVISNLSRESIEIFKLVGCKAHSFKKLWTEFLVTLDPQYKDADFKKKYEL